MHHDLPTLFDWYVLPWIRDWHTGRKNFSCILVSVAAQFGIDRNRCTVACTIGGIIMKVVIWKSPRYLCGMLRRMFGIRDDD